MPTNSVSLHTARKIFIYLLTYLCLTNLLEFLEFVTNYIDQGYPIDVIYLDFQKAFDKVPHKRLMMKIDALDITGEVFKWIEDRLKDREQRVFFTWK